MEEARIGVFVCHCGTNIGGFVDVPSVIEYVKRLPKVVYAEENLYTCADDGLRAIKNAIKSHNLNRVIVAACTPRTHAPLFKSACKEAGLNPYLFEFVNIRDQCSWVHMFEREKATEKTKDLLRMGIAKAVLLEPDEDIYVDVEPAALVIGGGIAGMSAALSLANQGFPVYLVEKEGQLGGMVRNLNSVYPTYQDSASSIEPLMRDVSSHERITVLTSARVKAVKGFVGNFEVTVERGGWESHLKVGAIIVAAGAALLEPKDLYGYGEYAHVVTQMQLEGMLRSGQLQTPKNVVMIQCVGSRGQVVSYCSRICCMVAIKNAILLRERFPEAEVCILHNDIHVYGAEYEAQYRKAREKGVRFIKYSPERRPVVREKVCIVHDEMLKRELELPADLVVLSTPLVPTEGAEELSKLLKTPLGQDRFFFEAHIKLRPVDFATDGMYVCGTARGPADVTESVEQSLAAASRAGILLWNRVFRTEAIGNVINPEFCIGCGICESLCPYGAIVMEERKARSVKALCKGCGTCSAACPTHAIDMSHFTDEQIRAQIKAAIGEPREGETKIISFCCNWCSYAGADFAGVSRFQYPPNTRIVRVMCSARVDPVFVLDALAGGADGVLVTGCHLQDCHYIDGNLETLRRCDLLQEVLRRYGMGERIRLEWVSASEGLKFSQITREFVEKVKSLGPPSEDDRRNLRVLRHVFDGRKLRLVLGLARRTIKKGVPEDTYHERLLKTALDEAEAARGQIKTDGQNKIPVFISSTCDDLKRHREAVWRGLQDLGIDAGGMEFFGARPEIPLDASLQELADCRVYIGIIGTHYGPIDEKTGKSVVQLEYEKALEKKLEVRIYLMQEGEGIPKSTQGEGELRDKLNAFRDQLKHNHACSFYKNEQDLADQIKTLVQRLIREMGLAVKASRKFIHATINHPALARGDALVISGTVTGIPSKEIAVWIMGDHFHSHQTALVGPDNTFQYCLSPEVSSRMETGRYYAVIQHPMENGRFDVFRAASGEEILVKNTADGRSFILEGKDALRGTKAVEALAGMFNSPDIDDVSLTLPFSIQDPIIRIDPISDKNVGEAFNISGITNLGEENTLHVEVTPSAHRKFFSVKGLRMHARIRRGEMGENRWSTDTASVLPRPQEYEVKAVSNKGVSATAKLSVRWRPE
jgi:heterodisulfide reductase subunit A